ncbi:DUF5666 domain-containing protein [Thermorudis peleae]|uniref:DUF5666 domain-containing protein n=1 Tax=Thermorudis peleae TaxID=1382356 RepID=UPI00069096CF|nr:DUF5666 domain-containing protein [Thermorudis peleae]
MRNRFTQVLAVVIILGLGIGAAFAAGSVYGRNTAAKNVQPVVIGAGGTGGVAAASGTADAAGGTGSGSGSGRQGFGGGGFGGAISGTVSAVNGQQLTLTLANGQQLTVALTADTHIGTVSQASQSALTSGAEVLVTGTRGSDGTLTASAVIVVPSGFLPTPAAGSTSGAGASGAGTSGAGTSGAGAGTGGAGRAGGQATPGASGRPAATPTPTP